MAARRLEAFRRPLRVYVDTSVFGGVHDDEFREPSERFFAAVRRGIFVVLVSEALAVEIASTPAPVRATFEAHRAHMEALQTTAEAAALAEASSPRASCRRPRTSTRSTWRSPPSHAPMPS